MGHIATVIASVVIAFICVLGVFSEFKDTLAQRISLGIGCISALGVAAHCLSGQKLPDSVELLLICLAVHSFEAARKFFKMNR